MDRLLRSGASASEAGVRLRAQRVVAHICAGSVRLPESTMATEVCCGLSHFMALVRHVVESDSASAEEEGAKGCSVVACTQWCCAVQCRNVMVLTAWNRGSE